MKKNWTKLLVCILSVVLALSMTLAMTSCGTSGSNGKKYTYNDYAQGSPKTWNCHEWETNEDSYIMGYCEMGFYDFILNDKKDGYEIVPEMAAAMPVDVTSTYAGNTTYGVPADAKEGYAFTIDLNKKACWQDGTKINADTYMYSMEQLLSSTMKNYRANSWYTGTCEIANAYNFYMQDQVGSNVYASIGSLGYKTAGEALAAGLELYVDMDGFWGVSAADGSTKVSIADDTKIRDAAVEDEKASEAYVSAKYLYDTYLADGAPYSSKAGDYLYAVTGTIPTTTFDQVGLIKTGDYQITLVLAKPITMFYLKYSLSSNWIVYKDLYEANKTQTGSLTKTTYGTSAETYMAYGPYKLTEYQVDKQITLEKNEKWYGYSDGKHKGQFQTTGINCQIVDTHETALQLFLQGKLDTVSLDATDMDSYRSSDYILFTPQSYTSKLTFNSDKAALKARETAGVNRTILSYKDFRHAIALCVDRKEFAAQCTATHVAGFGLLNYEYVYDPDTGALYRDSDVAKQVLCDVYGVSNYADLTGYDKDAAQALFLKAYNDALAAGDIKETDKIELEFLVYQSDESYVKIVNFFQSSIDAAVAGTALEGRITLKMTADANYYDNAKMGKFEIIISTWGGSSMDPYGILECYCKSDEIFEYGFHPETERCTVNVNGTDITKTFYEWYDALVNGEYAAADAQTRLTVLAGVEKAILLEYDCTPIYYRTVASLDSQRVIEGTDTYVQIVGFGGVRFMTYNMDDTAWNDYCTKQNNQLTY